MVFVESSVAFKARHALASGNKKMYLMQLPAVFIEVLCLEPEGKKRADNVGNLVQLSMLPSLHGACLKFGDLSSKWIL